MEMRGGVTDAGQQTNTEDRATQPMEAGGWVSQLELFNSTQNVPNGCLYYCTIMYTKKYSMVSPTAPESGS